MHPDVDDFDDVVAGEGEVPPVDEYQPSTRPGVSGPTAPPPIVLELGGIEDFETAVAMLRATGARRLTANGQARRRGRGGSRTFVIDHDITAVQAAALVEFIRYGTAEGFLTVTVYAPELDYEGVYEWWETA